MTAILTVIVVQNIETRNSLTAVSPIFLGAPALDANGLMAWGLWETQLGPDTLYELSQIDGVAILSGDNWRQESGWVDADPEDVEPVNNESHEDN